jgi:hypothetical protein
MMFTFSKISIALAFAVGLAIAVPVTNAPVDVVRRVADPAVLPAGSVAHVARVAEPEAAASVARPIDARQLPLSVPDAISTATNLIGPLFTEIESALASGAPVATLVSLWSQVFTIVQSLTGNINALEGASGALGGLDANSIAPLFTTLVSSVTTELQTTVSGLPSGSASAFQGIFSQVTNQLISSIQIIAVVIPGIGPILSPLLGTAINTLSSLAGILGAPLSLILSLLTLLLSLL